jgi:hypothetical protein
MFQDHKSRAAIAKNKALGITELIFGGMFTVLFGYMTINSFILIYTGDDIPGIIIGIAFEILFLSFFALIVVDAVQRLCFIRLCKNYLKLLSKEQSHLIDRLSELLITPAPVVRKRLEKMISKGYLGVAYIDDQANKIICSIPK